MLGERIAKARKSAKYSDQKGLANALGVGARTLADYENNNSEPKAGTLIKIAETCNVDPTWLLTGEGDMYRESSPPAVTGGGSEDVYKIPALELKASAGGGNHLESIDSFDAWRTIDVDRIFFKFSPSEKVRAIQVDGYSMAPMLMPDSWVFFELDRQYEGDGLYIINWRNILMVKKIQLDMKSGQLRIISVNPDYESYDVDPDDQSVFKIVGKVIRAII